MEADVKYAVLAGRQLFSIIFIIASARHFIPQTIALAASHHVPLAHLLVPLSGVMAWVGGLSVLVGFQTRVGAWPLVSFLVPVTVMMHNFWGALLISYFGAGPLSLDGLMKPVPKRNPEHGPTFLPPTDFLAWK
jgi:putative oxidoreductase